MLGFYSQPFGYVGYMQGDQDQKNAKRIMKLYQTRHMHRKMYINIILISSILSFPSFPSVTIHLISLCRIRFYDLVLAKNEAWHELITFQKLK